MSGASLAPFVWDQRYVTGNPQVDAEHQQLIQLINQLVEAQSHQAAPTLVKTVLTALLDYAATHFQHEEQLMAAQGCDLRFLQEHAQAHRQFAKQVAQMQEHSIHGQGIEDLLQFLTGWLVHHILGMDQSMARQIAAIAQGVSPEAAYATEQTRFSDPGSSSLLDAMQALYRLIAHRNDALQTLNASLEQQVAERTAALTQANQQLQQEHLQLQLAMRQVEITQKKLLESEHRRAIESKRQLERFLAQIIDGDPVPTLVIDARHRITHWNQACALISGLPAAKMIGTNEQWQAFYPTERPILADLIVNGEIEQVFGNYYQGAPKPSAIIPNAYESEGFFPHLGEGGRWLFFTAAPLLDADGQLIGAIETLQDVTERRQAEEALKRHQTQLESQVAERTHDLAHANQALAHEQAELKAMLHKVEEAQQQLLQSEKMAAIGQLAAGIAHEINNPVGFVNSNLGTLKTYIDRLLALTEVYEQHLPPIEAQASELKQARSVADLDFLREDLPDLLRESREGLERVTRIVHDLKDFSRVDQAERQAADLNLALESTLNVVRNELKYKADIHLDLAPLPPIDCYPAQINQVFMNLLVNAAQAIPQHGDIRIRSGCSAGGVWFEIEDNGKGMPAEVQKRIFEPFFTTKPVGKGTGLGLSISYDIIVKKHGGKIEVRSQENTGTTFRVWLPLHPLPPQE